MSQLVGPQEAALLLAEKITLENHGSHSGDDHRTLEGSEVLNSDMAANVDTLQRAGVSFGSPGFFLGVHFHRWLNHHDKGYDVGMVKRLLAVVEVKRLPPGTVIYDPTNVTNAQMSISCGENGIQKSALVRRSDSSGSANG